VILALVAHGFVAPALAWNEKGHMVVARLTWLMLPVEVRQSAISILKTHPHYEEYLSAGRPDEIAVDEWVFMRAAYWPDWVRSNYSEQYNQPTWHYVTVAFVPPQSKLKASDVVADVPNIVTQIPLCVEKIRSGTAAEKPIYLCWLLHLVGDIHQPLHCASLYSEEFPGGDKGGNLGLVRINGGMPVRLHFTWDALLGDSLALASIHETVAHLKDLEQRQAGQLCADLKSHPAVEDWAKEGFDHAKASAYLQGDLAPANADRNPSEDAVPNLADTYLKNATEIARYAAVKASYRLAARICDGVPATRTASPKSPSAGD
jgi:hypothetical protein